MKASGSSTGSERQQVVAAARQDDLGDFVLGADGVDADQRALEREAFEQQRDGHDLVRLAGYRLLAQHQALAARPRGHQVQRFAPLTPGMGAPGRLAVDRHDVGRILAQPFDPRREARLESLGIEDADHLAQRVVRRHAVLVSQKAPQKLEVLFAPQLGLNKVVRPRKRRAQQKQYDLGKRIENLRLLARILQGRKMIDQRRRCWLFHQAPPFKRPFMIHIPNTKGIPKSDSPDCPERMPQLY